MLVRVKNRTDGSVIRFGHKQTLPTRLIQKVRREWRGYQHRKFEGNRPDPNLPFSDTRTDYLLDIRWVSPPPDVLSLYWISDFPDFDFFFSRLPANLPIVWRLSDMNPFTGGCHHAFDCNHWKNSCGCCPQLGSSNQDDLSYQNWKRKKSAYENHKIQVVAPSCWIAEKVKQSSLLGHKSPKVIPNGVDTITFKPKGKSQVRDFLQIPKDIHVILAVASYVDDSFKGFRFLLEALNKLNNEPKFLLLLVGEGDSAALSKTNFPFRSLGRIQEYQELASIYSAADLFVIPSIHENLPNTALEAMACGVPIVAYRTGGIPEVVVHDTTGKLAERGDVDDLSGQIHSLLIDSELGRRFGLAAREMILREHTMDIEAQRYADLYENLVNNLHAI